MHVTEAVDTQSSTPAASAAGAAAAGLVHTKQSERSDTVTLENNVFRRCHRARRRTITQARLADQEVRKGGFRGRWLLVTTTYRDSASWEPQDVRDFCQRARVWYRRQGQKMRYQWVLELTKRGRPHYHLLVWVPRHLMLPQADRRGWWSKGMTKTETARNPVGYLAKYASKGIGVQCDENYEPYQLPEGARICGGGGLGSLSRAELRYWMAPRWFREQVPEGTDCRRVSGGYIARETGEFFESPWIMVGHSDNWKQLYFKLRASPEPSGSEALCAVHPAVLG